MSYILDALKKSEQERGNQQKAKPLPLGEGGVSSSVSQQSSQKPLLILLVVIAALLGVIAVLMSSGEWAEQDGAAQELAAIKTPEKELPEKVTSKNEVRKKDVLETIAPEKVPPEKVPPVADVKATEMTTGTLITPSVHALDEAGVVADSEASVASNAADRTPFEALERIPSLTITGHTYSSVPAKRQVVMNGLTWKEGDPVAKGVTLKEITRDGITLDVSGWPVVIGRSRGWQAIRDGH